MTTLVPLLTRRLRRAGLVPLLTRPLHRAGLVAVDAVLALGLVALCGFAASEQPATGGVPEPGWLVALTGVLVGGPVAVRRRWPVAAAGTVAVAGGAALLTRIVPDYASAAPALALACALYTVGAAVAPRRSVLALAGCLAALVGSLLAVNRTGSAAHLGFFGLMMTAGWLLGRLMRERRAYAARATEQLAQRAVADERLRIAREMHDIVAHSMSLIAVKAAVGNHVAEADPGQAREALRVIEATSRGALVEMRRALGVLREETEYAPAPGLADLPALARQSGAGGVDVELTVDGDTDLPEGVGLSVFRIVQEALTNVVKHAGPVRCRIAVAVRAGEVRIEVTDDGSPADRPTAPGHGLIGIRERVAMYGGQLVAGPHPGGGFRVSVRLPYGTIA